MKSKTIITIIMVVILLGGLAAGLYFLIKYIMDKQSVTYLKITSASVQNGKVVAQIILNNCPTCYSDFPGTVIFFDSKGNVIPLPSGRRQDTMINPNGDYGSKNQTWVTIEPLPSLPPGGYAMIYGTLINNTGELTDSYKLKF